jgi:hypothetical protein
VGSAPRHSVILTPTYVRTEWVFDFKPAHTPEREREMHGTKKLHDEKTVFHGRLCILGFCVPKLTEQISNHVRHLALLNRRKWARLHAGPVENPSKLADWTKIQILGKNETIPSLKGFETRGPFWQLSSHTVQEACEGCRGRRLRPCALRRWLPLATLCRFSCRLTRTFACRRT